VYTCGCGRCVRCRARAVFGKPVPSWGWVSVSVAYDFIGAPLSEKERKTLRRVGAEVPRYWADDGSVDLIRVALLVQGEHTRARREDLKLAALVLLRSGMSYQRVARHLRAASS
jgi:hypothetical protein